MSDRADAFDSPSSYETDKSAGSATAAVAEAVAEPTCVKCGNTESWNGSSWCPECGYYPSIEHVQQEKREQLDRALASVADEEAESESELAEVTCEKCGTTDPWGETGWCPNCGYCPKLNCEGDAPAVYKAEVPDNLLELIPEHAWIIGGCVAIVVIESVAARILFGGSELQTVWSVTQLMIGLLAFIGFHIRSYFFGIKTTDKMGPVDLIINPMQNWRPTTAALPQTQWLVSGGAASFMAMVCAWLIIGGLSMEPILNMIAAEAQEDANSTLMAAIASNAARSEGNGSEDLEEAVDSFAGDVEVGDDGVPLEEIDCLILGYTRSYRGELSSILLAAPVPQHGLQYVGSIRARSVDAELLKKIERRLEDLHAEEPFVECDYAAQWLTPTLLCRVSHQGFGPTDQLTKPEIESMLKDYAAETMQVMTADSVKEIKAPAQIMQEVQGEMDRVNSELTDQMKSLPTVPRREKAINVRSSGVTHRATPTHRFAVDDR